MPKKSLPIPEFGSVKMRKQLSAPALFKRIKNHFKKIQDNKIKEKPRYGLDDVLMSALAMFSLKDPSLLQFDQQRQDPIRQENLHSLFGIENVPCDSQMRSRLDRVSPLELRPVYRDLHQQLQKNGVLEPYRFLGKYLVSIDGTGMFSSSKIHCDECCQKHHKNGNISYYHQLLAAVIVHPEKPQVLPLCPETITRQDGSSKNDCEHNGSARLLPRLREDFPRLDMIVLQDALACNGPHIERLKALNMSFIITAKPAVNSLLLHQVIQGLSDGRTQEFESCNDSGVIRGYRFINDISLNHENKLLHVNFIDYWEEHPNGKTYQYACVSDLPVSAENVADIVRAGRTRWKVENETFNTLKNQGYRLEHNYGHGSEHLSSVFGFLMMLAFLIDQIQESCCAYFQAARNRCYSRVSLWQQIRSFFQVLRVKSWQRLYALLIWGVDRVQNEPMEFDSG